jgi:polyphosphate kinase
VRFAAIRRLSLTGITGEKYLAGFRSTTSKGYEIVIQQQSESLRILNIIELETKKYFHYHRNRHYC